VRHNRIGLLCRVDCEAIVMLEDQVLDDAIASDSSQVSLER
jgi:hypothetical protein